MLFTSLRFRPAMIVTLLLAMALASPATAQDQTASDLLDQGVSAYQDGDLAAAKQTLERVDRVQLDDDGKQTLDRTLELIDAEMTARQQLDQATQAEQDGALEAAKSMYRKVTANAKAPRTLRQEALRGLARVERRLMGGNVEPAPDPRPAPVAQPASAEDQPMAEQDMADDATAVIEVPPMQPAEMDTEPEPMPEPQVPARQTTVAIDDQPQAQPQAQPEPQAQPQEQEEPEPGVQIIEVKPEPAAAQPMTARTDDHDDTDDNAQAQAQAQAQSEAAAQRMLEQARKLQAQKLVAEAQAQADAGNYNNALNLYEQAAGLDSGSASARQGQENMRVLLARGSGTPSVLQEQVQSLSLKRQRALSRYNELMNEASRAREAGNYAQASDAAALAKSVLDSNRQFLDEGEYQDKRQQTLDLATAVQQEEESEQAEELASEQQRLERRAVTEREQARSERQQKVQELLRRARDLSREQKYDQALEQIEQIMFIDRNNDVAQFMRDLIRDQQIAGRWRDIQNRRGYEIARQRLASMEDTVPNADLIVYPPDWPELTQRRLGQQGQTPDSEADRITREKMQQTIPVSFQANRLENVIEYFKNVTGANIIAQWNTLELAGIAKDTPITMDLNVSAAKALELILRDISIAPDNLGFAIDEGVVIISTEAALARQTQRSIYDIKDLVVQIPSFDQAPEFDLNQIASDTDGGGGGQSIFQDVDDSDDMELPRSERIDNIMQLIRTQIDPLNWVQNGGETSAMEELNGVLIVTTTAKNHRDIVDLLRMLREQRALQIAVESRFLFVTQNFLEEVGVDVGLQYDASSVDSIVGTPGFQQNSADAAEGLATSVEGSLPDVISNPAISIGSVGGGGINALSFLIDDLQVSVLIRATQADVRSITVNTPRVTFFNGQRAYVTLSRQVAFVSDLEPVTATNSVAFDPEISVVSDGIVLDVEGTISADRRYVTLTVRPSLAQLTEPIPRFPVFGGDNVGAGGGGDGIDNDGDGSVDEEVLDGIDNDGDGLVDEDIGGQDATGVAFIQQPTVTLTAVRTTVSVPDKGTLLLGGQRLVGEVEREVGVPILSKIPLINRLFTNRSTVRDERTLLMLIKPTIIVQSEEEDRLFPGLNQSPGLYNLGAQP